MREKTQLVAHREQTRYRGPLTSASPDTAKYDSCGRPSQFGHRLPVSLPPCGGGSGWGVKASKRGEAEGRARYVSNGDKGSWLSQRRITSFTSAAANNATTPSRSARGPAATVTSMIPGRTSLTANAAMSSEPPPCPPPEGEGKIP